MSVLYVPHHNGLVPGMSSGLDPWVADHPGVTFASGQPVFATQSHAATWLDRHLEHHPGQPVPQMAAVYGTVTYHGDDGRTRPRLDLSQQQLREPHRQMVLTVTGQRPDPRLLAGCYEAAQAAITASTHGGTSQSAPTRQLVAGRYQVAFGHGYQSAYSNAGYALHTRVAAALGGSRRPPDRLDGRHELRDQCWRTRPPVPDPPGPADVSQAARPGWLAGIALGGAHGALEAAQRLRAAIHDPHARIPRRLRHDVDAVLHEALAATVPPWSDRDLSQHATALHRLRQMPRFPRGGAAAFPAGPHTRPPPAAHAPPPIPAAGNHHTPRPARPSP